MIRYPSRGCLPGVGPSFRWDDEGKGLPVCSPISQAPLGSPLKPDHHALGEGLAAGLDGRDRARQRAGADDDRHQ
jgi:hypothetical protein